MRKRLSGFMHSSENDDRNTFSAVSQRVRDFYGRHPYPRPVSDLKKYAQRWSDPQRKRADFHLFQPGKAFRADGSILVAGCGTSQAAKYAVRWPEATVTGIDVSSTSIDATNALKARHGLDNLAVHELPIETVADLGQSFDMIVCTGVLHHLADPDAGVRGLKSVLAPEGAMHLMVYARFGRTGIYMIQEFARRLGIAPTSEGIAELAQSLKLLPAYHPLVPLLRGSPDFQNEAGLADALLNPNDRPYSVDEFFDFLAGAGLRFGRWLRQAEYSPQCGLFRHSPHGSQLETLPVREASAAVELFRGTLVRHSAVAYLEGSRVTDPQMLLAGEDWAKLVPMRSPDTLAITENIPPGAAAVLINRTHSQTDIFLPVDAEQKRVLEAIDGTRSIGDLDRGKMSRDALCRYLEALWTHDQILFDASGV
jgi:SAM-dependent methyltransferase